MREYFYKDSEGKIKKFVYCTRGCKEPYRQEDIGSKIFKATKLTFLCYRCIRELNLDNTIVLKERTILKSDCVVEPVTFITNESSSIASGIKEKENLTMNTKEESSYYGIVVQCSDSSYYFGVTTNVEKAIKNHNSGCGSAYTKKRRPVRLITSKGASSREEAKRIKKEYQLIYRNT